MKSAQSVYRGLVIAAIFFVLGAFRPPAAQTTQAAPPPASATKSASTAPASICGTQPQCYEAADFAATITDFGTSVQGPYKVIDATVRFQNKTANPLILGYAANSGTATDDRGNRYVVYGANGYRGIGLVYGNTFDPKFTLSAGGYSDAQFELMWAPGQQIYGFTFELDVTVDEITTVEGNQHQLGGEFPLHYKGLINGTSASGASAGGASAGGSSGVGMSAVSTPGSAAQMSASAGQAKSGCPANGTAASAATGTAGSAGGQGTASSVDSAVATTTSAISNISSLFGHKKKAAAPASASASPCPPAASATANTAAAQVNAVTAAAPQPAATSTPAATTATNSSASATTGAATPATAAKPATQPATTSAKKPPQPQR